MNRTALLVGSVVTVTLLVFLALGFRSDPRHVDSPLIGEPAPTFVLVDLDGNRVALEELAGTPVVINFWATWCQPCIVEHPVLVEASRRYREQVRFLGVIYQDEPETIRDFLARRGSWGPALLDPQGRVAIAYGVYGAPETYFIDRSGIITEKMTGAMHPETLAALVESLL